MKVNFATISRHVSDEASAYFLLEQLRWPTGPVCPHCGHDKAYFLRPVNGATRATGPKKTPSQRRLWKCAKCRKQFSVITGTVMHGTKVSIEIWLRVMVQMCSAKNGISAREVERMHGVTPETAWFMLHRLREAIKRDPLVGMLGGTVTADETWIGGDPNKRNRKTQKRSPLNKPLGTNRNTDKTAVFALVDTVKGEVRSQVVPNVSGPTLRKIISEEVDMANSHLHTDMAKAYPPIGKEFLSHERVNHSIGEYVRDGASTNKLESYFSQLKRSIDGTHHHVSREHLHRYLAEFDFKYSTCKMEDTERLQLMVKQAAGRRLTYKPLTQPG